jgi:hypothetical protein
MNPYLRMILCGLGAGLLAALLWAGFSYAADRELGWIAWGVGLIVGLGVRWSVADADGWVPGIIAAVLAVPALLGGKYLAVRFIVERELAQLTVPEELEAELAKVELGKEVVAEYEAKKKPLNWPKKTRLVTSAIRGPQSGDEFPLEVWSETCTRWGRLPPAEQEQRRSVAKKHALDNINAAGTRAVDRAFAASFSPYDLLWFLLAIATAFRIGSRLVTAEE